MILMTKFLGAACVVTAGTLLGMARARVYARRVRECEEMLRCLASMRREIAQRLTPMPELFRSLSQESGVCRAFFAALAAALDAGTEEPLSVLWRMHAEAAFPPSPAREQLIHLGTALGCYDAAAECAAIDAACAALEEEYRRADALSARDGQLWRRLGVAGGILAAVCLI
ncbi:MAG: hypothetical protein E7458_00435 [Ruminococcaceae bacterium]|nr:hypothetical protein [Oscillospiraceae bacterium]